MEDERKKKGNDNRDREKKTDAPDGGKREKGTFRIINWKKERELREEGNKDIKTKELMERKWKKGDD